MSIINNILGIAVDANGATSGLAKFTGSAHNAGKATEKFERTTKNLTMALGTLGGVLGIRQLVEYADTWTLISARISLVTNSAEQMRTVQMRLYDIAQKTRNTLAGTAVLYTRVALNADQLGRSHLDLLNMVSAVNSAMLLSGATGVEAAQGMRQLAQALGSGRLQGDEFRTVMEAMPMVARAIAETMGVELGALYEKAEKGLIDVQTVIDAMLNAQKELEERAASMPITIGQSFIQLKNAVTMVIGITNEHSGASMALGNAIRFVWTHMEQFIALAVAAIAAMLAAKAAALLWAGGMMLLKMWSERAAIQLAIIETIATVRAFWTMAKDIRMASDAFAVMSMVGPGVIKILALVVGLAAGYAAYHMVLKQITDATDAWKNSNADLTEVIGERIDKEAEADKKTRLKIDDMIREAHQAVVLSGLQDEAAERMKIRFDAVNKRIEARRDVTAKMLPAMLAAIDIEERLALQALETTTAIEKSNKSLAEQVKITERFAENFQRAFGDTFEQILNDGLEKFTDLFSAIKKMFFRLLADMMAAKMMQKVGGSLTAFLGAGLGMPTQTRAELVEAGFHAAVAAGHMTPAGIPDIARGMEDMRIAGITTEASKSWASQNAKYLGPVIAGFLTGRMVGGLTTNPVLGTAGGALSGAAAGAMYGSVIPGIGTGIGAAIGGLAGAMGGLMGSLNAQKERDDERKNILKANTLSIRELTESFNDNKSVNERYTWFLGLLDKSAGGSTTRGGWEALPESVKDMILKIAEELDIVLLNKQGKYVKGTMEQLAAAVQEAVRQLTTFGENLRDIESAQESYNRIFEVDMTPQQHLEDSFAVLNQMAPQLMNELGLTNLDLSTEIGRNALRTGFQEIWNMINEGLMTPELLGAFSDKNQLLDAIIKVVDGLEKFNEQLYKVTTDFPRAMDIIYYEQKFGKYGIDNSGTLRTDTGVGTRRTDGNQSSGFVVNGGIHISNNSGDSGEDILSKIEYAAQKRRSKGGQVSVDSAGTF